MIDLDAAILRQTLFLVLAFHKLARQWRGIAAHMPARDILLRDLADPNVFALDARHLIIIDVRLIVAPGTAE